VPAAPRDRPHFHIEGGGQSELYTSPRLPIEGRPPFRARAAHAERILAAVVRAVGEARERMAVRDPGFAEGENGFYLEFEIPIADRIAVEGLENRPSEIELVAVRPPAQSDVTITATVYVPERSADFFDKKIEAYRDEDTPQSGRPKNERLVARIEDVRLGVVRSLFTDDPESYPAPDQQAWWEVWLRDGKLEAFRRAAARLDIPVQDHAIRFPERDVVLARADEATIRRLVENTDTVAELRIAKDTATLFLEMRSVEQAEWVRDLAQRVRHAPSATAPAVCLLDSGANRAHPLIEASLDAADQYAYREEWGVGDSAYWNGHGTAMAGIALYGDLQAPLVRGEIIDLHHRLETVKILPPTGQNDPALYGAITGSAIERAEAGAPQRRRAFCMAVTSEIGLRRHGLPLSTSFATAQGPPGN
jgi:Subtilase family